MMLRLSSFLLLWTATSAFGMDMASLEAVINSCQKGQICSCPRAKIGRIDKSGCGREPEWVLDKGLEIDGNHNNEKFEKYNKCLGDLSAANTKIDRYNSIFDRCQNADGSSEKTKFTNLPARPAVSGEDKTLNEQVQDVKAAEREQALREGSARQAEKSRAYGLPTAVAPQLISGNGLRLDSCGGHDNSDRLMCVTSDPRAPHGTFLDRLNGVDIVVFIRP